MKLQTALYIRTNYIDKKILIRAKDGNCYEGIVERVYEDHFIIRNSMTKHKAMVIIQNVILIEEV